MTSRKRKGDAGEAAYADLLRGAGCSVWNLGPSVEGADLLYLQPNGRLGIVEVKAWNRKLPPSVQDECVRSLMRHYWALPRFWQRRAAVALVHARPTGTGSHDLEVVWHYPPKALVEEEARP